jgi:hypothetical protein
MALNAFELVELRMLEQRRSTGSDGRDWVRMVVGVLCTTTLSCGAAYIGTANEIEFAVGMWLTLVPSFAGVVVTTWWIISAGEKAVKKRVTELRQQQRYKA